MRQFRVRHFSDQLLKLHDNAVDFGVRIPVAMPGSLVEQRRFPLLQLQKNREIPRLASASAAPNSWTR